MNNSNRFDIENNENNNINSQIGLVAFFKPQNQDQIVIFKNLFNEYIPDKYKNIPREIEKKRNMLIYLCIFQILAFLLAMIYVAFRRSFVYLIINLLTLTYGISGLYGAVHMNLCYLVIHCIFTTSLNGTFFIYQIIDFLLAKNTAYGDSKRLNDNILLLIFSLPNIYDFCVGVYNYSFLKNITDFNKAKEDSEKCELANLTQLYTEVEIQDHLLKNEKHCVICLDSQRTTVIQPCGHVLSCESCIQAILRKSSILHLAKCPLCRTPIESYGKFILA